MKKLSVVWSVACVVAAGCDSNIQEPSPESQRAITTSYGELSVTSEQIAPETVRSHITDRAGSLVADFMWSVESGVIHWAVTGGSNGTMNLPVPPNRVTLEQRNDGAFGLWQKLQDTRPIDRNVPYSSCDYLIGESCGAGWIVSGPCEDDCGLGTFMSNGCWCGCDCAPIDPPCPYDPRSGMYCD
jgi:hypothetical protein